MSRLILLSLCFVVLSGCSTASSPGGRFAVAPGGYQAAFDWACETLLDRGFTLNRVDAAAGVVTTKPQPGRGLLGPWERQQPTLSSELADAMHTQSRTVRIDFIPAKRESAVPSDLPRTQLDGGPVQAGIDPDQRIVARVTVLIERRYRPGFRPQVADVIRSGRAVDPQHSGGRDFSVVVRRDEDLEDRIAGQIASGI